MDVFFILIDIKIKYFYTFRLHLRWATKKLHQSVPAPTSYIGAH